MIDPIIIVGSGLAGYSTAKEWRKFDTETPLVVVTANAGNFYSKPQLSTALTMGKTPETLVVSDAERVLIKNCELSGSVNSSLIDISGGNIEINDSRTEQLNAGAGSFIIDKTGGELILDDFVGVTAGASDSIQSSTAPPKEDIVVYGGVVNVKVTAADINQLVNTLTVDANVT